MLAMPASTPYDLRFRVAGIPIRVHPMFWIVSAILGGAGVHGVSPRSVMIWVSCVFVSILVHELGHGITARVFGYPAEIALYWMGGLCASNGERQTPRRRLAVLIAGPGAGFVLAGLVYLAAQAICGGEPTDPIWWRVYKDLMWINLGWGLVNLLPIYPLDGGQITSVLLVQHNRRNGMRRTHIISVLTAGILAVVAYRYLGGDLFLTSFFAMFAIVNYLELQRLHQYAQYGVEQDDADWWKR